MKQQPDVLLHWEKVEDYIEMASNEEYLDNLLKTITAEAEEELSGKEGIQAGQSQAAGEGVADLTAAGPGRMDAEDLDMSDMDALLGAVSEREASPALQDVMQMSEDDIDRMLEANKTAPAGQDVGGEGIPDLSDLFGGVGDEDLQEISSLLEKSDQNEAVDENVLSILENNQDQSGGPDGAAAPQEAMEEGLSSRAKRAAEKKAKREAKKAAKLEKKNQKKNLRKKAKEASGEGQESTGTEEASQAAGSPTEAARPIIPETGEEEGGVALEDLFFNSEEEPVPLVPDEDEEAPVEKKPKKGFFARLIELLTEEEEEEANQDDESASLNLSDENAAILEEMKKEGKSGGGKKKKSKKKGKAAGKEAAEQADGEQEEDPKGKKKKEKKPKKEKKVKEAPVPEEGAKPDKTISLKKVLPIAIVAVSITAALIIGSFLSVDYSSRKNAAEAFYSGDYQECYQDLFGKKLDETEEVMFHKSEYILRMRLYLREYEYLAQQGQPVEALDSLIQTVNEYTMLYQEAVQWNAGDEVVEIYQQILGILSEKYQLSEAQALEIAALPDDVEYTRTVRAVAGGMEYIQWKDESDRAKMQDVLPEEEEIQDTPFVDSNLQ